jgi:hypothetical protein
VDEGRVRELALFLYDYSLAFSRKHVAEMSRLGEQSVSRSCTVNGDAGIIRDSREVVGVGKLPARLDNCMRLIKMNRVEM